MFVQDRDTSDLWLLDLDGGAPSRLTTGRDPQPYWEDTPAGDLARRRHASRTPTTAGCALVPTAGGPPRRVIEAGSPVWLGNDRLVVSVERDRCDRLAVVSVDEAWPQRLARAHGDLDVLGDEQGAIVSPDGATVAYVFVPHSDYSRYEIRVVDVVEGTVRALTGTPGIRDYALDWSPDGSTLAVASELSGWFELHLVAADGSGTRQLTSAHADFLEARWHPDGTRLVATRGRAGRFDLVTVDRRRRFREPSSPQAASGSRPAGRRTAAFSRVTRARRRPPSCGSSPRARSRRRSTHRRRWPSSGRRTWGRRS